MSAVSINVTPTSTAALRMARLASSETSPSRWRRAASCPGQSQKPRCLNGVRIRVCMRYLHEGGDMHKGEAGEEEGVGATIVGPGRSPAHRRRAKPWRVGVLLPTRGWSRRPGRSRGCGRIDRRSEHWPAGFIKGHRANMQFGDAVLVAIIKVIDQEPPVIGRPRRHLPRRRPRGPGR